MCTSLCPELDVFDSHGHQLFRGVGIPNKQEYLVLVTSGGGELLSLPPIPHHNAVVIIQTHRGKLLAIT
jgi:hypothetical protein